MHCTTTHTSTPHNQPYPQTACKQSSSQARNKNKKNKENIWIIQKKNTRTVWICIWFEREKYFFKLTHGIPFQTRIRLKINVLCFFFGYFCTTRRTTTSIYGPFFIVKLFCGWYFSVIETFIVAIISRLLSQYVIYIMLLFFVSLSFFQPNKYIKLF